MTFRHSYRISDALALASFIITNNTLFFFSKFCRSIWWVTHFNRESLFSSEATDCELFYKTPLGINFNLHPWHPIKQRYFSITLFSLSGWTLSYHIIALRPNNYFQYTTENNKKCKMRNSKTKLCFIVIVVMLYVQAISKIGQHTRKIQRSIFRHNVETGQYKETFNVALEWFENGVFKYAMDKRVNSIG